MPLTILLPIWNTVKILRTNIWIIALTNLIKITKFRTQMPVNQMEFSFVTFSMVFFVISCLVMIWCHSQQGTVKMEFVYVCPARSRQATPSAAISATHFFWFGFSIPSRVVKSVVLFLKIWIQNSISIGASLNVYHNTLFLDFYNFNWSNQPRKQRVNFLFSSFLYVQCMKSKRKYILLQISNLSYSLL